jgi:hypothetical protein
LKTFFFFLAALGFELRVSYFFGRCSTIWATPPALCCVGYFWVKVSQTICLSWLWTMVLLISAFWVARIMGMSHRCLA